MAAGLPDLVECARLAESETRLERAYELGELDRLRDKLAQPRGTLNATFAFAKLESGRPGAVVTIDARPQLICQRCLKGFDSNVSGGSEIEFAPADEANTSDPAREFFTMQNGRVSLRELAEEELLLALPIAPMCSTPLTCANAPVEAIGDEGLGAEGGMRRPFGALQDLLKKT